VPDPGLPVGAGDVIHLPREAPTQVRCAAGVRAVSVTSRATVAWVRAWVDPPAP
jgi:hypothetical protein